MQRLPLFLSVGIKGHAVAEAVAEAPKGVARALLYMSLSLLPSSSIIQDILPYLSSLPPCMDDEDLNRGNTIMNRRKLKFPRIRWLHCAIRGLTLVCE